MRKICIVTGTRAEYGLFLPILKRIETSKTLTLQLVVTSAHLSPRFGLTYRQIEKDGFRIDAKIENLLSADTATATAKSAGLATLLLSDTFERLEPDIILLLGDRYETLAAATAALLMKIPVAHIHGGETTEGTIDEQIRHAITKMSYLHFTATEPYRQRVIQMGEDPKRVFVTGAPGIDNILRLELLSKSELERQLRWRFGTKNALFTYHPCTLCKKDPREEIETILKKLEKSDLNILFTYANADTGGHAINEAITSFCNRNPKKYKAVESLGQQRYLSAMRYVDLIIGNSSSAIIEAASFRKPVVNIGARQKGRLQSGNVVNCEADRLNEAIKKALTLDLARIENIYGTGCAAEKIVDILEKASLDIVKRFQDH